MQGHTCCHSSPHSFCTQLLCINSSPLRIPSYLTFATHMRGGTSRGGARLFSDICATRDGLIAPHFLPSQWRDSNSTELIPHLLSLLWHTTQHMKKNSRVGFVFDRCGVKQLMAKCQLHIFVSGLYSLSRSHSIIVYCYSNRYWLWVHLTHSPKTR